MKSSALRLVVCILAFMGLAVSAVHAEKLLIVGEEYAPFEFTVDGNPVGIDVDLVGAIMQKLGVDYEIRILPWDKAWKMIEDGEAEATLSTSRKEKREPYVWYPAEDMWVSEFVFFVRADRKKAGFSGYADAGGLKVGTVKGNSYNEAFWNAKLTTVESLTLPESFQKLDRGEVDLVITDKTLGKYTLIMHPAAHPIDYYNVTLFSKGYPMPFAKKSDYPGLKKIADDFEKELAKMKKSGEYDKILLKWLKS